MIELSPHGEGYCTVCRFIVGLDADGVISFHERPDPDASGYHTPARTCCRGTGKVPPKRTPYASEKNRFYTRPAKLECPRCRQEVKVNTFTSGKYYVKHNRKFLPGECPGSLTPVRPPAV